jgi:hypothetical protein
MEVRTQFLYHHVVFGIITTDHGANFNIITAHGHEWLHILHLFNQESPRHQSVVVIASTTSLEKSQVLSIKSRVRFTL